MILDLIENAGQYAGLYPGVDRALKRMQTYSPENYPGGKVEVDGDRLFLLLNSYETHESQGALMEAHRRYLDVMYMVEGEEIIYVKPTGSLGNVTKPYDESIEALLAKLDEDATAVRLTAGSFIVLFPQDAHAPGCCVESPTNVKKIIGKVQIG